MVSEIYSSLRLSKYNFIDSQSVDGKEFIIDETINVSEKNFEKCKFYFQHQLHASRVIFRNCTFLSCEFIARALPTEHKNGAIEFYSCQILGGILNGDFGNIIVNGSNCIEYKESTHSESVEYSASTFRGFQILGSCKTLSMLNCNFEPSPVAENEGYTLKKVIRDFLPHKSIWNKKIVINANFTNIIFDNVGVHPFYIATKCQNKKTVDLTRATLIDDWSRLRKKYTGVSLFIVFLLTLIFVMPWLTKAIIFILSSKINSSQLQMATIPLWNILLYGGKTGITALGYGLLTITLLIYNVIRFALTIRISRLREEELFMNDTKFEIASIHPEKIQFELLLDKIVIILGWLSIGYSVIKIYETLTIAVPTLK